jgi:hypothetical protein
MKLGKHFTLAEFTASQTAARRGISNAPDDAAIAWLRQLVQRILDPLREHLGRPVVISSGYRSPALNKAIGGSTTSQHCLGQAADITVPGMTVPDLVATIRKLGLPFDQLIDEFSDGGGGWVHVSYGPRKRRQVLKATRGLGGRTVYREIP